MENHLTQVCKIIETVRLKDYFEVEIMGKPLGSFDLMKGKVGEW